tara:strand:- start:35 stop:565 length:531 start_codon:yes stop_codon:yes gene_type:complete
MVNQNNFPTLTYDANTQSDFTKQMLDLGIIKKSNVQLTGEERDRFTGGNRNLPQDFFEINQNNPLFNLGATNYRTRTRKNPVTGEDEEYEEGIQDRIQGTMTRPMFGATMTPESIAAALGTIPQSILQNRNALFQNLGPLARFFVGSGEYNQSGDFMRYGQPAPMGQPNFQALPRY